MLNALSNYYFIFVINKIQIFILLLGYFRGKCGSRDSSKAYWADVE